MHQGTLGHHISLIRTNKLQRLNKSSQFGLGFLSLATKRILTKAEGENAKWQFDSYHLESPVKKKKNFYQLMWLSLVFMLSHGWLWDSMDCTLQAPLSMEFSRQEYWSGLPFPTPQDLPNPGIELTSPASPAIPALAGRFFTTAPPGKPMAFSMHT